MRILFSFFIVFCYIFRKSFEFRQRMCYTESDIRSQGGTLNIMHLNEPRNYTIFGRMFVLLFVPASIAFAVSFFFVGNLLSAALSLLGIGLIVLPEFLAEHTRIKPSPRLNLIYYGILLVCYLGELVFDLDRWIPGYDLLCHLLMAAALVIAALAALPYLYADLRTKENARTLYMASAGVSCVCGALFELTQLLLSALMGGSVFTRLYLVICLALYFAAACASAALLYRFPDKQPFRFICAGVRIFVLRNAHEGETDETED